MIRRHYGGAERASMKKDLQQITRRWLARFSFSFLVIAFFLGYEGYKRFSAMGGQAVWRTMLDFFGATVCVLLSFTGLRKRHRNEEIAVSPTNISVKPDHALP